MEVTPLRKRTAWVMIAGVLTVAAAGIARDAGRPPDRQRAASMALAAIRGYQRWISPYLAGLGIECRFRPTCSRYAEAAILRDGIVGGTWRAVRRIARCGPWTAPGTLDPL